MVLNKMDLQTERYIINRFISMVKLFDELGIEYRIDGNLFCPFHQNENTPAAHLYSDETGYRLWCFSESKMYGSWNIYKVFKPNIDTNKLALAIFNRLSETDQKKLLNELGTEEDVDVLPFQQSLIDFKRGKINMSQLKQEIAKTYLNKA